MRSDHAPPEGPRHLIVGGVSGAGKSTVAAAVAGRLGWPLLEGDDLHPATNIARMSAGVPLTDEDRWPWLAAVAAWIQAQDVAGRSSVTACSALRRAYRDRLAAGRRTSFVLLTADRELLLDRMRHRTHFMPPGLLDSQLATYEPLGPDEHGLELDAARPLESNVSEVLALLDLRAR